MWKAAVAPQTDELRSGKLGGSFLILPVISMWWCFVIGACKCKYGKVGWMVASMIAFEWKSHGGKPKA
jgi:hypothetical protein